MNYATTFAAIILLAVPAFAQEQTTKSVELRVDTSLFVADESSPVSHNVTLFTSGQVFDFGKTSEKDAATEITVYDIRTKMFTLLDNKPKVKFSISQSRLVQLTEAMRAETAQDPKLKIFATAEYTETADNASGWTTVNGGLVEYRFKGKSPRDIRIVDSYCDFLDQYTLLAVIDPRRMPPFPRLRLNQAIKKQRVIPSEIRLDIKPMPPMKNTVSMKSKHTFVEHLSTSDKSRIESVTAKMDKYKMVTLSNYKGMSDVESSETEK